MRNKLYFYRSKEEFDKYFEQNYEQIVAFEFLKTKELIESTSNNIIDITNMVAYVDNFPANIYTASINLQDLDENNKIIILKKWSDKALEFFLNNLSIP